MDETFWQEGKNHPNGEQTLEGRVATLGFAAGMQACRVGLAGVVGAHHRHQHLHRGGRPAVRMCLPGQTPEVCATPLAGFLPLAEDLRQQLVSS